MSASSLLARLISAAGRRCYGVRLGIFNLPGNRLGIGGESNLLVEFLCEIARGGFAVVLLGHIQNGMIVTETALPLPEGAAVRIEFIQDELDPGSAPQNPLEWTAQLDDRRCFLIDLEIAGTLSFDESVELERLQKAMLDYRRKVAPLPIEAARRLQKELLSEIGGGP